ncbi:hypothetical protein [Streptomyces xiamenensis]|uniref:hypothetical protein n=1 Tax=Streptomyces xiamenensis TaxID=408015 RepID=UPI003D7464D8
MSDMTPERLEQVRAQHAAGLLTNTAAELLAEIDRQAKEIDRLAADRHHWMTQYYEESRTYWDAELPPGGECCAVCYQPVESEPCPDHHPRTVVDWLTAGVERLNAELAARPTRAEVLREAADTLVAACPDHGHTADCRISCACDVADELRRDGGAR